MLLYIINLLWKNFVKCEAEVDKSKLIKDSVYIAELGYVRPDNNIMSIHEGLIKVVDKMNEYDISYEEIILVVGRLLMNFCYNWIIDKYNETFYKYIDLEKKDIVMHITRNLLVNNELAMTI